ncbi:MAG: hypothetical protein E4G98_05895 [Promethearchaeota archaeon]|nr:MAG: hypothetical protein E4G98_05895 [Candidatus Lokiarchaeota archaeon]
MQAPTHFLTGMVIYIALSSWFSALPSWLLISITVIASLLSHFLLDCLAKLTYHLPDPQWKDPFWVTYHVVFVYVGTLVMLVVFWKEYWWVMFASIIPDIIDWYFLRPFFKKGPVVHPLIDWMRKHWFNWVPDWTDRKWTVALEIAADVGLLLIVIL